MRVSSTAIFSAALGALLACTAPAASAQKSKDSAPHAFELSGDYWFTHDPSVMKEDDTWYVFATGRAPHGHMAIRCSHDLKDWKLCGQVFTEIPDWIQKDSPGTKELWAPDISYFDGLYHLYYAYSLFGKNTSGIALATNKTLDPNSPDYKWMDQGLVLRSVATDDFNAIDPNLIIDKSGKTWLAFGSFWSGIKMRRIDRATGKLSTEDTKLYAARHPRAPRRRRAGHARAAAQLGSD